MLQGVSEIYLFRRMCFTDVGYVLNIEQTLSIRFRSLMLNFPFLKEFRKSDVMKFDGSYM